MIRSLIPVIAPVLLVGLTTTRAEAEEQTLKFRLVSHKVNATVIPATETEGHILGVSKWRGVAVFEDGRLANKVYTLSFDYMNGLGPFHGYSTYTFEDGSTIRAQLDGVAEAGTDGRRVVRGEYSALTGTGQYEGVKGSGWFKSKPVPWDQDTALYDNEFKLTMP
jgi:hypothetical protein